MGFYGIRRKKGESEIVDISKSCGYLLVQGKGNMAAKLLHSLTDETPDLQKQIGCMTGVFHMFDPQHILTSGSRRRLIGHTLKRLSSGNTNSNNSNRRSASSEKYSTQEKERILSTESSRASFSSSSRSSSFSSVECNRAPQPGPAPNDRSIGIQNSSSRVPRQSLDIRGLVKDSMHREIPGLSLKPKEETNEPRGLLRSASYHMKEEGSSFSVSKDAPRFSFDGRGVRRAPLDVPTSIFLESTRKDVGSVEFGGKVRILGRNQTRPPGVVAKLMGLEGLPDSISSSGDSNSVSGQNFPDEEDLSDNPKSCSVKPVSRFPIEPAPWKQKSPAKDSTAFPSLYGEIEKKLNYIEFAQSEKGLRALEQILEAMRAKGFLETKKEARGPSNNRKKWTSSKWQHCESSPIVIMKPAKLVEKSGIPESSVIPLGSLPDLAKSTESFDSTKGSGRKSSQPPDAVKSDNMKNGRTLKNAQMLSRMSQSAKDGNLGPRNITRSISPGIQQKKIDPEKRSRPPISGSSKSRRLQSTKNSPVGCSEISPVASSRESLSLNASKIVFSDLGDKKSTREAESAELGSVPPEYPSPVSVLDKIAYKDDSTSPEKYVGKTLKVDAAGQENPKNDIPWSGSRQTHAQINRKKLEKIETLVQKLRRLNSAHDEARTDYIASLCEQTDNPDHRYISEILLASGLLLKELGSGLENFRFHPSGHPIDPELFLVLEQTQSSGSSTGGRPHRKLIFDAINEILGRKLAGPGSGPLMGRAGGMGVSPNRILGELCLEIEGLWARCGPGKEEEGRWKEPMLDLGRWRDFEVEISGVVLDIERSIFKDLVSEVVVGESKGSRAGPGRAGRFEK